jgi:hypothetical protein
MGAVYDSGDDGWSWGIGGRNRWGSKGYGWCPTEAAAREALVAVLERAGWVVDTDTGIPTMPSDPGLRWRLDERRERRGR